MLEILQESIRLPNLPFTVLLAGSVGYWLLVAAGLLDLDSGDGGLDVEVAHGAEAGGGLMSGVAQFLNLGQVPLMVIVSLMALFMWMFSMIGTHYWAGDSLGWALVLLVPNVALSLGLTWVVSRPVARFFRRLNAEGDEHLPLIGRTCEIMTSTVTEVLGQARVERKGSPVLLNVRPVEGERLERGDTALIVRKDPEQGVYYVRRVSSEKL